MEGGTRRERGGDRGGERKEGTGRERGRNGGRGRGSLIPGPYCHFNFCFRLVGMEIETGYEARGGGRRVLCFAK